MPRPDEGLIHAWLDGECTPDEAARIERLVETDPEWSAAVAEARGLIAASSRIVSALDSVPTAMPAGSRAAPQPAPRRGFRVPAWMGMAAALVLVAGTAYVLRDRANEPFAPSVTAEQRAPDRADTTSSAPTEASAAPRTAARTTPPPPPPPRAAVSRPEPAATAGRTGSAEEAAARRQPELEKAAAEAAEAEREWRRSRSALRQAAAPAAAPLADAAVALLEGCWRVTAPPQAVGVLRFPRMLEQRGDSLRLVTLPDTLWVTRAADRLHGSLEAERVDCPPEP